MRWQMTESLNEISYFISSFSAKRNQHLSVVESCPTCRQEWAYSWFAFTNLLYEVHVKSLNGKHFGVYREFITKEVIFLIIQRISSWEIAENSFAMAVVLKILEKSYFNSKKLSRRITDFVLYEHWKTSFQAFSQLVEMKTFFFTFYQAVERFCL